MAWSDPVLLAENGTATSANDVTSPSFSWNAGDTVFAFVSYNVGFGATSPDVPTLTGLGVWETVNTAEQAAGPIGGRSTLLKIRMAAGGSSTLRMQTNTADAMTYHIWRQPGMKAGAAVQSKPAFNNNASATLTFDSAFANAGNMTIFCCHARNAPTLAADAPLTSIGSTQVSTDISSHVSYRKAEDATPSITLGTSRRWAAVGGEFEEAPPSVGNNSALGLLGVG